MNVTLIECGGLQVNPKCRFDIEMEVCDCKMLAPTLAVRGHYYELILGNNVIKPILQQSELFGSYWRTVSQLLFRKAVPS